MQRIVLQVPDAKLKYQQLLAYGKKLGPLPPEDHTEDNKVRGCVSQVCSLKQRGLCRWNAVEMEQ
jgi:sulfur transfer protein SufE